MLADPDLNMKSEIANLSSQEVQRLLTYLQEKDQYPRLGVLLTKELLAREVNKKSL
jgi:hypothetical protein